MKLKTKFQDEDFELGEVVEAKISTTSLVDTHIKVKCKAKKGGEHLFCFASIKEFTDLFEDYEEPKEVCFIDYDGGIIPFIKREETTTDRLMKSIGNYFETKEEAEKAVEKLKAWKRLKDKGICFYGWRRNQTGTIDLLVRWEGVPPLTGFIEKDLDLLFDGGEE